jgi:hypothetical protein
VQPNTEISHRSSNLFSATEVAETIGTDLETINEWLEVGAIDRVVFGGGRFSKYELQRAALTFEMVKLGLAPSRARDVVWEMEYDLQQIWGATVSNHYKAYAILIPNKQNKWWSSGVGRHQRKKSSHPRQAILYFPCLTSWPALPTKRSKRANSKAFGIAI